MLDTAHNNRRRCPSDVINIYFEAFVHDAPLNLWSLLLEASRCGIVYSIDTDKLLELFKPAWPFLRLPVAQLQQLVAAGSSAAFVGLVVQQLHPTGLRPAIGVSLHDEAHLCTRGEKHCLGVHLGRHEQVAAPELLRELRGAEEPELGRLVRRPAGILLHLPVVPSRAFAAVAQA